MPRIPLLFCAVYLLNFLTLRAQTSISGVINNYYEVTGIDICNNSLTLDNTPLGLSIGDNVLLIQMRGVDAEADNLPTYGSILNYAKSGDYEMFTVQNIVFNVVTLNEIIDRPYDLAGRCQLVRVPEYVDVDIVGTVTGLPWNGTTGGIISLISTVQFHLVLISMLQELDFVVLQW